jgi:hypothetical protein
MITGDMFGRRRFGFGEEARGFAHLRRCAGLPASAGLAERDAAGQLRAPGHGDIRAGSRGRLALPRALDALRREPRRLDRRG